MILPQSNIIRTVHCHDALDWLRQNRVQHGCSLVASMPDISEFSGWSLEDWKKWFVDSAALIISSTPDDGVSIFFQSDIKLEGTWVDKSYLCQKAAEQAGTKLLWHKIACRAQAGQATFGRPAYSHILCFSKALKAEVSRSTADVIPDLGEKTWERGMGFEACLMVAKFIAEQTPTRCVINPFCGHGSVLAMANAFGLSAVGIERSAKRAELARSLSVQLESKTWVQPAKSPLQSEVS